MLITQELHVAAAWLREQHVLALLGLLAGLVSHSNNFEAASISPMQLVSLLF